MTESLDYLLGRLRASAIGRRLMRGAAANLLDKFAVLVVQSLSIPLLTYHWGADGYGVWVMLMTVPTYLVLGDFGATTAAGVEITRNVARGNHEGALAALQSTWAFATSVALLGVLAIAFFAGRLLVPAAGQVGGYAGENLPQAIFFVGLYAVVLIQISLLEVVYQATHKYSLSMTIAAGFALLEGVALVIVCLSGGGLVEAAFALLLVRSVDVAALYLLLRRREPWFGLGLKHASVATFRSLAKPSLGALALTSSSALGLQGMVLSLGWAAGPASVAVFSAARFLTRIPLQLSGLLIRASIPELTRSRTAGNESLTRRLLSLNVGYALVATIPFFVILSIAGPWLLGLISGGRFVGSVLLFALLSSAATLNAVWQAAASPLVAMNQQSSFAYWYLAGCAVAVCVPLLMFPDREISAAVATMLAELAGSLFVAYALARHMPRPAKLAAP